MLLASDHPAVRELLVDSSSLSSTASYSPSSDIGGVDLTVTQQPNPGVIGSGCRRSDIFYICWGTFIDGGRVACCLLRGPLAMKDDIEAGYNVYSRCPVLSIRYILCLLVATRSLGNVSSVSDTADRMYSVSASIDPHGSVLDLSPSSGRTCCGVSLSTVV